MTSPSIRILLGGSLLLAASACSGGEGSPAPAATNPPSPPSTEITSGPRQGETLELVFALKQQSVAADGTRVIEARGTHNGTEVGLIVALGPDWESVAPDPKSKFAFHQGTVEYRTIGEPSDALLAALDELYATKLHPRGMRAETKFAGATLEGDPADLAKGEVRLKLSFESPEPERRAEVYTTIDLPRHVVRIREKDEAYRGALVRALQKD
jgi:hypothetical protein